MFQMFSIPAGRSFENLNERCHASESLLPGLSEGDNVTNVRSNTAEKMRAGASFTLGDSSLLKERDKHFVYPCCVFYMCVCVCVCVSLREKEREKSSSAL